MDDPLLLVRSELAGRAIMREAAARQGRVMLCSNVDYQSLHAWGTHENYECRTPPGPANRAALLTHLATRIVFSGAGGPHPRRPGMRLVMSPRAALTIASYAGQGTLRKAMIFRKPDDYGAGHRLHVFSGESLLCPHASWLKYGTTALVAEGLDAGWLRPEALAAQAPLSALHRFNTDLGFDRRVPMRDGTRLTALEIQRRFADRIAEHRESLPPWAGDVLAAWHRVLDGLEQHDEQLSGMIDWLLYRRLWFMLIAERGLCPDQVRQRQIDLETDYPGRTESVREQDRQLAGAARELYVRLHALDDASPLAAAAAAGWLAPPLPGL